MTGTLSITTYTFGAVKHAVLCFYNYTNSGAFNASVTFKPATIGAGWPAPYAYGANTAWISFSYGSSSTAIAINSITTAATGYLFVEGL